jgi:hypothetical protein
MTPGFVSCSRKDNNERRPKNVEQRYLNQGFTYQAPNATLVDRNLTVGISAM